MTDAGLQVCNLHALAAVEDLEVLGLQANPRARSWHDSRRGRAMTRVSALELRHLRCLGGGCRGLALSLSSLRQGGPRRPAAFPTEMITAIAARQTRHGALADEPGPRPRVSDFVLALPGSGCS